MIKYENTKQFYKQFYASEIELLRSNIKFCTQQQILKILKCSYSTLLTLVSYKLLKQYKISRIWIYTLESDFTNSQVRKGILKAYLYIEKKIVLSEQQEQTLLQRNAYYVRKTENNKRDYVILCPSKVTDYNKLSILIKDIHSYSDDYTRIYIINPYPNFNIIVLQNKISKFTEFQPFLPYIKEINVTINELNYL